MSGMFGKGRGCVTVGHVDHDGIPGHQIVLSPGERKKKKVSQSPQKTSSSVPAAASYPDRTVLPCSTPYSRKCQCQNKIKRNPYLSLTFNNYSTYVDTHPADRASTKKNNNINFAFGKITQSTTSPRSHRSRAPPILPFLRYSSHAPVGPLCVELSNS